MQDRFHILLTGIASIAVLFLHNGCETDSNRTDYGLDLIGNYNEVAGDVSEVALSNDRAWALTSTTNSILTFNLSEAAVPTPVGTALIPDWQQDETFISATWANDSLLLCTSTRNMKFVNISDSAVPEYFGWDFSGQINHVFPQPNDSILTVFAADRSPEDGIQVHRYDITSGSDFWDYAGAYEQSVFIDFDNDINDLLIRDEYLYAADGVYGLKVFRVDNTIPLELTEVTTLSLAGDARRMVVDDNLMVVCAGAGGVYCIDITDPFLPVILSRYQASYTAYDVELRDDHVFVAWSSSGVLVLDISDPADPQPNYFYDLPSARRIAVNDQVIAVVDGEEGLFFFENPLD